MGLENINLLNRAIRPLGFDRPLLAVTMNHTEDRFLRNYGHSDVYRGPSRRLQDRSVALVKRPCETTMREGEPRCDLR